jgi:hypothetical protein
MKNVKMMASMQARKAFVAAFIAMIGVAALSSTGTFTIPELLTIIGTGLGTFQATYWTTNKDTYDGALVVDKTDSVKDKYNLEIVTPL